MRKEIDFDGEVGKEGETREWKWRKRRLREKGGEMIETGCKRKIGNRLRKLGDLVLA